MRVTASIGWLLGLGLASAAGPAQTAANADAPASAAAVRLPPMPKSPIEFFRSLLAMSPAELGQTLAGIPESQRVLLNAKLEEYSSLQPEERNLRLRATELRWYLRPLMGTPATNRAERLASIPQEFRKDVDERLKQWDLLPPDLQREMIDNEWTIRYFLYLKASTPAQQQAIKQGLPAERRERLENELDRLRVLPPARRQRMFDNFEEFFELPPREKEKTLGTLSEADRREMEKTLRAFESLPTEQRRICISSFQRFTDMSPEDRAQFLKNADRWKELTPAERQTWRTLVTQLPPLPPGLGQPPLPPPLPKPRNSSSATNPVQ